MYTCKKCGKSGNKLWLSKNGYCETCAKKIIKERENADVNAAPYENASIPPKAKNPIYKKWWFYLICAVVIYGIFGMFFGKDASDDRNAPDSGSLPAQAPEDTAALTDEEPDPEPTPDPTPEPFYPLVYTGTGDYYIMDIILPEGNVYRAEYNHDGSSNFSVWQQLPEKDLIVNEIGVYSGGHLMVPGDYGVEITADGNWELTISALERGSSVGASGIGDDVSGWFTSVGSCPAEIAHSGESNFVVWLHCITDGSLDLLVNTIGNYSGTKYVELDADKTYCFCVTASGSWDISLKE